MLSALGTGSSWAQQQQVALQTDHQVLPDDSKARSQSRKPHLAAAVPTAAVSATDAPSAPATSVKPAGKPRLATAVPTTDTPAATGSTPSAPSATPARKPQSAAKGPYYVDFRARTAASYGHAFVWYGKTTDKKVDVAGLHPAGDEVPYVLGHLMFVPSETGASYGDLDEQYLTASYRVYLSEADAQKVFAYIRHLQATSPIWNAETLNCTHFIGQIATFMGLKVPFHLKKPEEYINELRALNGGRPVAQVIPDRTSW
jgi:hypothetical protein